MPTPRTPHYRVFKWRFSTEHEARDFFYYLISIDKHYDIIVLKRVSLRSPYFEVVQFKHRDIHRDRRIVRNYID